MLLAGEINIFVYIVFLIMTASIYLPIEGIIAFMGMIDMLDSVVGRIKEIKTMPIQEGESKFHPKNYDIEFKDVSFGYEDYSVVRNVSFTAKQGEVTALIGASGSGKTTLTKLAARFWDINKGKILLGGEDISKVDPEALLKNFSIVFQEVVLFNTSIKENIRIGKKGATDAEIFEAAKIARCDEFIEKMPNGIETVIGENGERLSGGERQRISIARAILKDAPLNIADDYFKAKKQGDSLESDIELKDKEMYDLKHELISAQIKLENAEKELAKLKEENNDLQMQIVKLETEMKNRRR